MGFYLELGAFLLPFLVCYYRMLGQSCGDIKASRMEPFIVLDFHHVCVALQIKFR